MNDKIKLKDACKILNGFAFKSGKYVDSGIRIIRIANVQKGYVEDERPTFYPNSEESSIRDYMLEEDDLLLSLTGNVGRVALLDKRWLPAALNQRVACLRIKDDRIIKDYLYFALLSDKFENDCTESSKGIAQKNMSTEWLKDYEIPLPSRQKQREIISSLKQLSMIIKNKTEQIQQLDDLIKARFVEMFGDKDETKISDYIDSLEAGKSLAGTEKCENKVLKTSAVSYDYFDVSQTKYLPKDYRPVDAHKVNPGNIVISRMNTIELVGAAAYVWNVPDKIYLPDRLWKAKIKNDANPIFVWQTIIHPKTKELIRRIAGGTSGSMKNISKSKFLEMPVKKATREEQDQFAIFVTQIDKSKFVLSNELTMCNFYIRLIHDRVMHSCINLRVAQ